MAATFGVCEPWKYCARGFQIDRLADVNDLARLFMI